MRGIDWVEDWIGRQERDWMVEEIHENERENKTMVLVMSKDEAVGLDVYAGGRIEEVFRKEAGGRLARWTAKKLFRGLSRIHKG